MTGMTTADSNHEGAPPAPYRLASAAARGGEPSVLHVGDRRIGGEHFALIAGPCTVETLDGTIEIARVVRDAGATMLRGGAYKPRTSPYAFQGLGGAGLAILAEAKAVTGLPVVTELLDARDVEAVLEVADMIQIGARNMQNYALLTEVGRTRCPVMIKRGLASTSRTARRTRCPNALCDGPQTLRCDDFARFVARIEQAAALHGKGLRVAVA